MECERVRDRFSSLLENELDPLEEKMVREHLDSCKECERDLRQFDKTMQWLHSVKEVEVPDGFLREIQKRMEESERKAPFFPMSLKLPIQAVAMVAVVFFVLYLTKMMPGEISQLRDVEQKKPLISTPLPPKKLGDQVVDRKEMGKSRVVAQPSSEPSPHLEITPVPSEKKKMDRALIKKEQAPLAAKPSQEIVVRTSDQEKTLSRFHELLQQFDGKIINTEGNIFIASLPASRFSEFEKELSGLSASGKSDQLMLRQDMRGRPDVPGGVKSGEFEVKGKEPVVPETEKNDRLLVRVLLIQE